MEEGIEGEKKARSFLRTKGIFNMQQIDWLIKKDGKYCIVEVKEKELYNPPPFFGTGLDIKQIKLRTQIYNDLNIDTILLVFIKNTSRIYYQYLSILERTDYFDTKNGIRIYNINAFKLNEETI